ncbi:MAG: T9SS C-terminal target domain-containing protein [Bacteroidetes bacterium]|nr:MAG: T9SS C-terminal target domain-containing protein [Bacteroidota bacterium]
MIISSWQRYRSTLYGFTGGLLFLLLWTFAGKVNAQRCLSQIILNDQIQRDERVQYSRDHFEEQLQNWLRNPASEAGSRDVTTIDVVVHVVWHEMEEMISEEQVLSQIEVLNEDFRALNNPLELVIYPPFQQLVADMELEFKLATVDPSGNPTNGINYVQTDVEHIASKYSGGQRRICHDDLGGADAWCYHNYLNIWVGSYNGGVLGEASFPGQEVAHPEEDGIRISYKAFGRTPNLEEPYHLGRTLTHEIGHFFNLFHPWGQSDAEPPNLDCSDDDGVTDTPKQAFNYKNTCFLSLHQSCGTPDLHWNFMNYTDDACMGMFSLGQQEVVIATLMNARSGLMNGSSCSVGVHNPLEARDISIFPNPVNNFLHIDLKEEIDKEYYYWILDAYGKTVVEKKPMQPGINQITLGNLENGFYLVTISDQEYFLTKKIVVIK